MGVHEGPLQLGGMIELLEISEGDSLYILYRDQYSYDSR
jgi:hypothetical protein